MQITILTLFPEMFDGPFSSSILKRAQAKNLIHIDIENIRDSATDAYKSVDGHPYGGGVGMILRVDIVDSAIAKAKARYPSLMPHVVLLDPHGQQYKEKDAQKLQKVEHLILLAAHYEGIDHRIRTLVDSEYSIGDYILTGGELAAMIVVDSVARLIPGVLGKDESPVHESFSNPHLLEEPQYTNPQEYKGMVVPEVLLSGHHKNIKDWREREAKKITAEKRPDLRSASVSRE